MIVLGVFLLARFERVDCDINIEHNAAFLTKSVWQSSDSKAYFTSTKLNRYFGFSIYRREDDKAVQALRLLANL